MANARARTKSAIRQSHIGSFLQRAVLESLEQRCLLSTGTLDTTYGTSGTAAVTFPLSVYAGSPSAVQSDGKLLVCSLRYASNGTYPLGITRLNTDGSVDTTYGSGGTATAGFYPINALLGDTHLALQSDGKALLAGDGDSLGGSYSEQVDVERFTSTGAPDTTFGSGGIVNLASLGATSVDFVAVDSSGRILVGASNSNNGQSLGLIFRLTSSGAIDSTFGVNGSTVLSVAGQNVGVSTLAVESDGSILVGGNIEAINSFTNDGWMLAHLSANGALDTSFGSGGIANVSTFTNWPPSFILPLSNGTFLAGGMIHSAAAIARFTASGTLDTTFGYYGVATIGTSQLEVFSAALASNGDIVCGGGGEYDCFVAALLPNGTADTSFGSSFGITQTSLPVSVSESVDGGGDFALDANGSAYVVNTASGSDSYYVTKYLNVTTGSSPAGNSVSGEVFNDQNASGTLASYDAGLPGITVYDDLNNNGQLDAGEPSAVTNSSGVYALNNLPAGPATLRVEVPTGYVDTNSTSDSLSVSVPSTNASFPLFQTMTFTGFVYNDANGNGQLDVGEAPVANVRVFVDANNNGVYDTGELTTTTDANGRFTLTGIAPPVNSDEAPTVCFVAPAGEQVETPAIGLGAASGAVYPETDGVTNTNLVEGYVDEKDSTSYWESGGQGVYVDSNNNGRYDAGEPETVTNRNGQFCFSNLPTGSVTLRLLPAAGYSVSGSGSATVAVTALSHTLSVLDVTPNSYTNTGTISGEVFNDGNQNDTLDPYEYPIAGRTVFIDTNNNGVLDPGEPTTVTDSTGNYAFYNLAAGTYVVREVLPSNVTQTAPVGGAANTVTLPSVANAILPQYTGENFGNFVTSPTSFGTVTGQIKTDFYGDGGVLQAGNNFSGWTVFADTNGDGVLDAGEVSTTTAANGTYTLSNVPTGSVLVRAVAPSGWILTDNTAAGDTVTVSSVPTTANFAAFQLATVTGICFNDLNGNGIADTNEPVMADASVSIQVTPLTGSSYTTVVQTDSNGVYTLDDVPPGQVLISPVTPAGYVETGYIASQFQDLYSGQVAQQNFFAVANPVVSGYVYLDPNDTGVRTSTSTPLVGWTVFADLNNDGILEANEPSATTNSFGEYQFAVSPNATYTVRVAPQSGYTATAPSNNAGAVTVGGVARYQGPSFGQMVATATASITGSVFNDLNGDGALQSGEPGLTGVTVYLDLTNTGSFTTGDPTAVTNASGVYTFNGLTAGTYTVRVDPTAKEYATNLANGVSVTAVSGRTAVASQEFGVFMYGSISGVEFTDANGDGVLDGGDSTVAGEQVYIDTNHDGFYDSGDYVASTDVNGNYSFPQLAAGTYVVRPVLPAGFQQTLPAANAARTETITSGSALVAQNFGIQRIVGGSISGTVTGGAAGETVYLDANNSGTLDGTELSTTTAANGSYSFTAVPAGAYIIRQILPAGYTQTSPASGYGIHITVTAGGSLTGENFTDKAPTPPPTGGSVSGTVTGGAAGETIYLDANNNSTLDSGELSTTTSATGTYSFSNVPAGAYIVRQVLPSGYSQTSPANGYGIHITVTSGGSLTNENFTDKAPAPPPSGATISGTVTGGAAGETIYLDANNNSILDSGEFSTTTSSAGTYSFSNVPAGAYIIRQILPSGYTQTSPASGYGIHITATNGGSLTNENFTDTAAAPPPPPPSGGTVSGTVTGGKAGETIYLDANNNSTLDSGELSTTTSASGNYSFSNVPAGAYIVRQVLPSGYTQTSPASGYGIHITVTSGGSLTNENFTDTPPATNTASIAGTVFNDANGNGKEDTGEAGLAGWTVYIDLNNSGSFVAGDPTATTDASGDYLFSGLAAGTYIVRVKPTSGYSQTTPADNYGQHITLSSGQKSTGVLFGEKKIT